MSSTTSTAPRARRASLGKNEVMQTRRLSGVGDIALPFWDLINNPQLVKMYLNSGGSATLRPREDSTYTMLHWACHFGTADIAEMLLKAGADPKEKDWSGKSPLDIAQERGYYMEMLEVFLKFQRRDDAQSNA
jgi:ankyrin repeat protein